MSLRVEPLAKHHDRKTFRCGRPELDEWLRSMAWQVQQRSHSARTYVLTEDGVIIVGFSSLASHAVAAESTPSELLSGQSRHQPVPAVLLARLAIALEHQGRRLGERLLAAAVRRTLQAGEHIGLVLIAVDALDEKAASFYERYGFVRLSAGSLRLVARVKDLRATFGLSV